jgi:hypothetical protein
MLGEAQRAWILAALALALGTVVYREWPATSAPAVAASNRGEASTSAPRSVPSQAVPAGPVAPDVHLATLAGSRAKPVRQERNLFRFKPKAAPPAPLPPPRAVNPVAPVRTGPPGPAPPPPITLKFIGMLDTGDQKPKVAILSDSAGHVFYGYEGGPAIEGRYRILKVGADSVEMSYLDGRGRTTLRLSGS